MLGTCKILRNVATVNIFDQSDEPAIVRATQSNDVFLRLWQSDRNERYVPAAGATLTVTFPRAFTVGSTSSSAPATDQSFVVSATNPLVGDTSIWKATLNTSQSNLATTGGVILTLVEGAVTTVLFVPAVIRKLINAGE